MICPICKTKLEKIDNSYKCVNKHCYDISKQGYINLLLNSKNSGDNKEMINSRHIFLKKGYYECLLNKISEIINELNISSILDIGCGEGYYDRGIKKQCATSIIGVDISKEACKLASRLSNDIMYVVSSINSLPFSDNEFDLLLNIFAPHNEDEFFRVCNKYILKVIPNSNHLLELKEMLYENVIIKNEKKLSFENFKEIKCEHLQYKVLVDDLWELFKMTPYYYKTKFDENIFKENTNKLITCDFTILLYEKINN